MASLSLLAVLVAWTLLPLGQAVRIAFPGAKKQTPEQREEQRRLKSALKDPAVKTALRHPPNAYTVCSCLNWRATYLLGRAQCGRGAELFTYTGGINRIEAVPAFMRFEDKGFCNDIPGKKNSAFFPQQDHSRCIRQNRFDPVDVHDSGYWCYVDGRCHSQETLPVSNTTSVRAKLCWAGIDPHLADLMPSALFELARKFGTDKQLMAQMAYRPAGQKWEKTAKLSDKIKQKNWFWMPVWFEDDAKAIKIAWADQLWHVFPDNSMEAVCVEGCDKVEYLWAALKR